MPADERREMGFLASRYAAISRAVDEVRLCGPLHAIQPNSSFATCVSPSSVTLVCALIAVASEPQACAPTAAGIGQGPDRNDVLRRRFASTTHLYCAAKFDADRRLEVTGIAHRPACVLLCGAIKWVLACRNAGRFQAVGDGVLHLAVLVSRPSNNVPARDQLGICARDVDHHGRPFDLAFALHARGRSSRCEARGCAANDSIRGQGISPRQGRRAVC